ncbi:MAG: aminotransferase [Solirubrobacterales bacterium]|nr:aminotransferase [Solirubrobacterales bacterium]
MGEARRGLILQHGDSGPPGILGDWLRERGIEHQTCPVWRAPLPPAPGEFGWIASLGSQHTPGGAGAPDWVEAEVDFLRDALDAGVPVLGLCFGGQALAVAAGGEVAPSDPPEIEWMEVETLEPELVPPGPWLHYHYDLLVPPRAARTVARSPAGPAAFTLDGSLGLQFHPESTPAIAAEWARQDGERLVALGVDPDALAEDGARVAASAEVAAKRLFDTWWTRLARP